VPICGRHDRVGVCNDRDTPIVQQFAVGRSKLCRRRNVSAPSTRKADEYVCLSRKTVAGAIRGEKSSRCDSVAADTDAVSECTASLPIRRGEHGSFRHVRRVYRAGHDRIAADSDGRAELATIVGGSERGYLRHVHSSPGSLHVNIDRSVLLDVGIGVTNPHRVAAHRDRDSEPVNAHPRGRSQLRALRSVSCR
jgi:hypothetical protein